MERRSNGARRPSEEVLQRWPADSALARTHSGSSVQLRLPSRPRRIEVAQTYILASTDNGACITELTKFLARSKHVAQPLGEASSLIALTLEWSESRPLDATSSD
jgi:hypothetical protein